MHPRIILVFNHFYRYIDQCIFIAIVAAKQSLTDNRCIRNSRDHFGIIVDAVRVIRLLPCPIENKLAVVIHFDIQGQRRTQSALLVAQDDMARVPTVVMQTAVLLKGA